MPSLCRIMFRVSLLSLTSPMITSPFAGIRMPIKSINRVDLPAPLAPMTPTDSPW